MDVVGVMTAYLSMVRVCTALSREELPIFVRCWLIKCFNVIDARYKHEKSTGTLVFGTVGVVQLIGALRHNTDVAGSIPGDMVFDYVSSGNEYLCVGLKALPPSCADCLEILGPSN